MTILLCEDNPIVARVACRVLTSLNYTVDLTTSGEQALYQYKQKNYTNLLVDMFLPNMNGLECIRELRRLESQNNNQENKAKFFIWTAAHEEVLDHPLFMYTDGLLAKPLKPTSKEFLSIFHRSV